MSFIDLFKTKADPAPPSQSAEEIRCDREKELRSKLSRIESELEAVSTRLADYTAKNMTFDYRTRRSQFIATAPELVEGMRFEVFKLERAQDELLFERSATLAQLSIVSRNKSESAHLAGQSIPVSDWK
jgi:sugar-specific transcriptional regulator TrmB